MFDFCLSAHDPWWRGVLRQRPFLVQLCAHMVFAPCDLPQALPPLQQARGSTTTSPQPRLFHNTLCEQMLAAVKVVCFCLCCLVANSDLCCERRLFLSPPELQTRECRSGAPVLAGSRPEAKGAQTHVRINGINFIHGHGAFSPSPRWAKRKIHKTRTAPNRFVSTTLQ